MPNDLNRLTKPELVALVDSVDEETLALGKVLSVLFPLVKRVWVENRRVEDLGDVCRVLKQVFIRFGIDPQEDF